MAFQLESVTGNRRLRPNVLADLNARLSYLPQTLANESQREFQDAQISNMEETSKIDKAKLANDQARLGLEEQGLGLQRQTSAFNQKATTKGMELRERSEGMSAGVGAAGLGFNILSSKFGSMTGGGLMSQMKMNGPGATTSPTGATSTPSTGGFWNDFPVGASMAGGLTGFAASKMLPTKNKFAKIGVGAGVGALTGFFGGGNSWSGAAGGGILGGLSGLF